MQHLVDPQHGGSQDRALAIVHPLGEVCGKPRLDVGPIVTTAAMGEDHCVPTGLGHRPLGHGERHADLAGVIDLGNPSVLTQSPAIRRILVGRRALLKDGQLHQGL